MGLDGLRDWPVDDDGFDFGVVEFKFGLAWGYQDMGWAMWGLLNDFGLYMKWGFWY